MHVALIYICIHLSLGLLPGTFLTFVTELWPLIDVRIFAQYLENKRTEFYQVILTRSK